MAPPVRAQIGLLGFRQVLCSTVEEAQALIKGCLSDTEKDDRVTRNVASTPGVSHTDTESERESDSGVGVIPSRLPSAM